MRLLHHTVCVRAPFQIVSDMYAEELEAFQILHCDVDRGLLPLLFTEVRDLLLNFVDIVFQSLSPCFEAPVLTSPSG